MSVTINESSRKPVVVTLGLTQPSFADTITFDGKTEDMTGATVVFFMRPLLSRTPVINGAPAVALAPPDNDGHNVRYDWQSSDVTIGGQYSAWWGYVKPGSSLMETPEFPVVITDHGPGFGTATGAVVDSLSQWMPVTIDRLRKDSRFGDRFLQRHADHIKLIIMGTTVPADQEENYHPALIDYLGKRTAIRLITPAKEYWARQHRAVQTQGPAESASYPDMLANLDVLHQRLAYEIIGDWRNLQFIVSGLPQKAVEPAPVSSLGDPASFQNRPVTPNPQISRPPRVGGPNPGWGGWFL